MDKRSRREWIRAWIALGAREGLPFKELSKRSGISHRTLSRWSILFREESRRGAVQDDDQQAFLQLVERVQGGPTRIEVYVPGEPRLVIDATAIVRVLASLLRAGSAAVIVLSKSVRIVAYTKPVTFQMHVDGLAALVRKALREDPLSGDLFCFFNIARSCVKLLVWDRNGFWVLSKRLERGAFQRLDARKKRVELSRDELVMLLEGIDLKTSRSHRNFSREVSMTARENDDRSARSAG